jgi:hypothetical protein
VNVGGIGIQGVFVEEGKMKGKMRGDRVLGLWSFEEML